jgi:protein-S-isoprenylcysteine O-methyltransferase Ste14
MADRINTADSPASITQLLAGIVTDVQTLTRQELLLAKTEMRQEWEKTKSAAGTMAAGAGLLTVAGLLVSFALVYLLQALASGLPTWACFAIVGLVLGSIGGILVGAGRNKASEISIIPPQTAETLKENAQWLKNQT